MTALVQVERRDVNKKCILVYWGDLTVDVRRSDDLFNIFWMKQILIITDKGSSYTEKRQKWQKLTRGLGDKTFINVVIRLEISAKGVKGSMADLSMLNMG